jgi:hypothetical protein
MNDMTETVERNAREFWTIQDSILDSMHDVAAAWFERRHAGTHAALDAAQRMCHATSPAELLLQYQSWAMGAFERVMADAAACQSCGVAIGRLMDVPLARSLRPDGGTAQAGIVVPSVSEPATTIAPVVKPPPLRKAHGARASAT